MSISHEDAVRLAYCEGSSLKLTNEGIEYFKTLEHHPQVSSKPIALLSVMGTPSPLKEEYIKFLVKHFERTTHPLLKPVDKNANDLKPSYRYSEDTPKNTIEEPGIYVIPTPFRIQTKKDEMIVWVLHESNIAGNYPLNSEANESKMLKHFLRLITSRIILIQTEEDKLPPPDTDFKFQTNTTNDVFHKSIMCILHLGSGNVTANSCMETPKSAQDNKSMIKVGLCESGIDISMDAQFTKTVELMGNTETIRPITHQNNKVVLKNLQNFFSASIKLAQERTNPKRSLSLAKSFKRKFKSFSRSQHPSQENKNIERYREIPSPTMTDPETKKKLDPKANSSKLKDSNGNDGSLTCEVPSDFTNQNTQMECELALENMYSVSLLDAYKEIMMKAVSQYHCSQNQLKALHKSCSQNFISKLVPLDIDPQYEVDNEGQIERFKGKLDSVFKVYHVANRKKIEETFQLVNGIMNNYKRTYCATIEAVLIQKGVIENLKEHHLSSLKSIKIAFVEDLQQLAVQIEVAGRCWATVENHIRQYWKLFQDEYLTTLKARETYAKQLQPTNDF